MPKVSIIVAAYNGERYIRETLESLLDQTYTDFEIIVADDGSTDGTAEIVKSFADKRIRYIKKENEGVMAKTRNFGIRKSAGEFIAFCDQDDIWYPEKLKKQLEKIDKNALTGAIVASADIIDKKGKKIGIRDIGFSGYINPIKSFEKLLDTDFITNCSAVVPKKIIEEMGYLDESLVGNDDYKLWLLIAQKYGIFGVREPLCAWRVSGSSYSKKLSVIYKENQKIFETLRGRSNKENEDIKKGISKNYIRLFMELVYERKPKEAGEALNRVKKVDDFKEAEALIRLFKITPLLAYLSLHFYRKLKRLRAS